MANVKLTNVKKIYGKNTVAVQDFNLEIADKEFYQQYQRLVSLWLEDYKETFATHIP